MSVRITVVLEYSNCSDVPRIGPKTIAAELGDASICSLQFSDALREMEVLERDATEETKDEAFRASYGYPGCTDPRAPKP